MRIIVRVLVAVTSLLTVLVPTAARADDLDRDDADRLVFHTSLADFTAIAAAHAGAGTAPANGGALDWSTDLCSAPLVGSTGRTFDFTDACRRHDFGYRNLARAHDVRKRIDRQFLADMKSHCRRRWLPDRPTCYSWAYTFYGAVRVAGGP